MTQDKPLSERMNQLGPDGINPQAKYFSREVAALEAENARLKQQLECARKKCEALREALNGLLNLSSGMTFEEAWKVAEKTMQAALAEPAKPQGKE